MWIDAKYKLQYKVRFTYTTNANNCLVVGQKYTGGDNVHVFAHYVDAAAKSDTLATIKTNIETFESSLDLTAEGKNFSKIRILK